MAKTKTSTQSRGIPLITIFVVILLLVAVAPLAMGLVQYNSGNYSSAMQLLKIYPFTQTQYRDCIEKIGDQKFADGRYDDAIHMYEQLGETCASKVVQCYCAKADRAFQEGASVSKVVDILDKVAQTPENIVLRDQVLLKAAECTFAEGNLEDTEKFLSHVAEGDVMPIQNQINAIYIQEALAPFAQVDDSADWKAEEPTAFALLRSSQEMLQKCKESPLAADLETAIQKLLDRDVDGFVAALQTLAAKNGEDPAAGEVTWSLWNCFSHMVSSECYYFLGNRLPYMVMDEVLAMGRLAATVADPAETQSGSMVDALAELAKDGEVRRWNQGICMNQYSLELTIDQFGKNAGETPKLLFIRNFLPAGSAPQEYCMDFGVDLNMMALLPLEYWPENMGDVTHVVSLHYFHEEKGEYLDKDSIYGMIGIGGKPGIQETACVRIYNAADGKILYQSESLTGPELPDSVQSDEIKGGYYSSGAIDLSQLLKEALLEVFPELDS